MKKIISFLLIIVGFNLSLCSCNENTTQNVNLESEKKDYVKGIDNEISEKLSACGINNNYYKGEKVKEFDNILKDVCNKQISTDEAKEKVWQISEWHEDGSKLNSNLITMGELSTLKITNVICTKDQVDLKLKNKEIDLNYIYQQIKFESSAYSKIAFNRISENKAEIVILTINIDME